MIDIIVASLDISFYEPLRPWPVFLYSFEGRVASPARSESMGMVGELWFVVCFQNASYNFLNHFVRPWWHAQWSLSAFAFGYCYPSHWRPLPSLVSDCFD